ncbi:hypothetical protein [Phytohabitans aurantiacus]|jgi:hypothetical protein|uniref:Ribbon-helix-helix protein CopG domain-containing protein n=1 Tax=Phytohabitans aurantiacus TaxID=3016789 RepID=A0ABQ5R4E3_9ACTN|nr:hypothetical protein [Phytohabitans aurantiacus]GLI01654.1 hypothetical protein Pa4123_69300 [Phytohabitans aurantiacus]
MAEKVTLTLSADTLARARAEARAAGMSLSEWIDRAARRAAVRDAARRHEEWLATDPDARAELEGFDRLADRLDGGWPEPPTDMVDAA